MHHKVGGNFSIVNLYGITQEPETKNYIMVLDYADHGSLRNYLDKNYDKLSWSDKLHNLLYMASGLRGIHEKELIHTSLRNSNVIFFELFKLFRATNMFE